jgi:hypothetical protein
MPLVVRAGLAIGIVVGAGYMLLQPQLADAPANTPAPAHPTLKLDRELRAK